MGFQNQSNEYNINAESEIAEILSHFSTQFITDVVKDNILKKFNYTTISNPNIVAALELNFKNIKNIYNTEFDRIDMVRNQTYREIIGIICSEYQCQFNDNEELDYYSAAFYTYDFFVSNFSNYIVSFFANYIYKERNGIYDSLGLANMKKNKDSSTLYGKKAYKDIKMAVINANLDFVINNIAVYDIDFHTILSIVYPDRNIVNYLYNIITPVYDFYKNVYIRVLMSDIRPMILSNIRFEIQKLSVAEM